MSDKTEKPSQKKLRDARKKGEVAHSKDVISTVEFVALLIVLWGLGGWILTTLQGVLELAITAPQQVRDGRHWLLLTQQALQDGARIVLPLLGAGVVAAVLAGFAQTRGVFSFDPLKLKFERMNPAEGLKRLFSSRQVFELLKLVAKVCLLGSALWYIVKDGMAPALRSVYSAPQTAGLIGWELLLWLFGTAAIIYLLTALADFGIQIYEFIKQQRMTKDEVRREHRDENGDPHVRGRRRALQRELASGQGAPLAKASVVVTNPTHVAVALYYERGITELPVVIAKELDKQALMLRRQAQRLQVPIVENVPLARRLYAEVPLNDCIEEVHFEAVAEVLRFVRDLKEGAGGEAQP
jgi:type III secretion protein U